MDYRLLTVLVLTVVIHMFNTLAYAVRPAGVVTKRIAVAFSLWNVLFLVSSTANTVQAPFMSNIIDSATGVSGSREIMDFIVTDFRLVLWSATLGTIMGALLIPSFVKVFTRSIMLFDRLGSVPAMIVAALSREKIRKAMADVHLPRVETVRRAREKGIPKRIMLLNMVITGVYTTGVLSSLYASLLEPSLARTALSMSAVVNGIGQVLSATMVDPRVAAITDEAARGERSGEDIKHMTLYLALSRIAGTLLAQVFFMPAAVLIVYVSRMIS